MQSVGGGGSSNSSSTATREAAYSGCSAEDRPRPRAPAGLRHDTIRSCALQPSSELGYFDLLSLKPEIGLLPLLLRALTRAVHLLIRV